MPRDNTPEGSSLRPYPRPATAATAVLLACGSAVRLWLVFGIDFLEEDSLITLRYAKNLWDGHGLVYNLGEKVMGFTSPLWTLTAAPIVGPFPISTARLMLTLLCLVLYAAAVGVWLHLGRNEFRLGPWGFTVFAGFLALEPRLAAESVSGMEMSLFVLLVGGALWAAAAGRLYVTFALASLSILTRPEGAILWAVIFGYVTASELRSHRKVPFLQSALPSAIVVLPWIAFATAYYGSPIPRSAASKSMWGSSGFSVVETFFRPGELDLLWRNMTGLYVLKLPPFARGLLSVGTAALWLLACGVALRRRRSLVVAAQCLLLGLGLFYYLGRGLFFPWYAVTTIVLFSLALAVLVDFAAEVMGRSLEALAEGKRRRRVESATAVVAMVCLAVGFAVMVVRVLPWQDARLYEDTVLKPAGEFLRHCTTADSVVMLEPLGYIGFYSGRQVLDLAGLVSPEFRPTPDKFEPGWGGRQVLLYEPDYLVLRSYEIPQNRFFASFDAPMFADRTDQQAVLEKYSEVARFESSTWPERSLVVYKRNDAVSLC